MLDRVVRVLFDIIGEAGHQETLLQRGDRRDLYPLAVQKCPLPSFCREELIEVRIVDYSE